MNNREGIVQEILRDQGLTPEERKKALWKSDVSFVKTYDRYYAILLSAIAIVWLLPAVAGYSGWGPLSFFARLPRVKFPLVAMAIAGVVFLVGICLDVIVGLERGRHGGCHDFHETVLIVRRGPYRVIRHPGYLAEIIYFSMLPIILSRWIPYTTLAAVCTATVIASLAYLIRREDHFNVKKWGEEYRRYMRQVPAINFVKGLWNFKQSKEYGSGKEAVR